MQLDGQQPTTEVAKYEVQVDINGLLIKPLIVNKVCT